MNDLLHNLIRYRLSEADKYRVREVLKEGGAYKKVFEYLAEVPEYKFSAMEEAFKEDADVGQLGSVMTNLYPKVMQGLWNDHQLPPRSKTDSISQWLYEAQLLENLGAFELAHKKPLAKALQKARQIQDHNAIFDLSYYIIRMIILYEPNRIDAVNDLYQQLQTLKQPDNVLQELMATYIVLIVYEQSKSNPEDYKATVAAFRKAYEDYIPSAEKPQEAIYYHRIMGIVLVNQGRPQAAMSHFVAAWEVAKNNPDIFLSRPEYYIKLLDLTIMTALRTEDYDQASRLLEEVKALTPNTLRAQAVKFQTIFATQIKIWQTTPFSLHHYEPELEKYINDQKKFEHLMDQGRRFFLFNEIAILYFINGVFDFAAARFQLLKQGNISDTPGLPKGKRRKDIQISSRLFEAVCQLEMGNCLLFSSQVENLRQYLARTMTQYRGSPQEVQLSFIDIMVKRLRSIDQQIQKNPAFKAGETYYKDLFKEALALYQKHSTITLHGAAEIMLWLAWKFPELRDQLPG